MTRPLLIGGATTSRQHTAVRIAPAYSGATLHVLDASRVVGVVAEPARPGSRHRVRRGQPRRAAAAARAVRGPRAASRCSRSRRARRNREQLSFDELSVDPAFSGDPRVSPSLAELREMIDWQFFFLAWELKGKYPAILDEPEARSSSSTTRNALLDEIVADGLLTARGGYGFWPAHSDGDDIMVEPAGVPPSGCPCSGSRPSSRTAAPNRCLADFVAPAGDHIGGFAVAIHGADELAARYESRARRLHGDHGQGAGRPPGRGVRRVRPPAARREWYEPDDGEVSIEDLHAERYRGIRPAFGLSGLPRPQPEARAVRPARRGRLRHGA